MSKIVLTKYSNSKQKRINTLNSLSSSLSMVNIQRHIGIRHRWESIRRLHQTTANTSHGNAANNPISQSQPTTNE